MSTTRETSLTKERCLASAELPGFLGTVHLRQSQPSVASRLHTQVDSVKSALVVGYLVFWSHLFEQSMLQTTFLLL